VSTPKTREEWADFSREFLRASGYPEGLLTGALDGVSIADGHTPELRIGPEGIELHAVPDDEREASDG
jgi:hypothetical protein